ncbi:MAG: GNAT family N-acetyltransferase [Acidobacteriaceae bacterium]|nr:GNAT family N-acetyltransferase [Acidobacteriaceae bacterium]
MELELIQELTGLQAVAPEWAALVEASELATPFQYPIWLLRWWEHFGSGRLHVLVFRREGRLAGVVPCFCHEWNRRSQLTLIGSGISDYLDPMLDARFTGEILGVLQQHLESTKGWEICDWQDLAADTPLKDLRDAEVQEDTPCTRIPLTGCFDEFWRSRSPDLRRNVRRYSQRARASGQVRFEVCEHPSPDLMNELIRLHTARWQKQGEPGMIAANRSEAFLRSITHDFAARGLIRFFSMHYNDSPAAVILAFAQRNKMFGYMSAFDPEYEDLGFGRSLLYEAIRYSFCHGYKAWDFLRGDERYKTWWGAEPIPKCRVIIPRQCLVERDETTLACSRDSHWS